MTYLEQERREAAAGAHDAGVGVAHDAEQLQEPLAHGRALVGRQSREEVEQLTGLAPGSIPPFGSLFQLPTWCDEGLAAEPRINFNAGDHGISISMTYADYARAERPRVGAFAELPAAG